MEQPTLFDVPDDPPPPADQEARDFAVDPANLVVLEASAGTGKTRVLVDRYVGLLAAGVDPRHILAITFTRKAAAEMRERVLVEFTRRAARGEIAAGIRDQLSERMAEVQISTIDAFCYGLLREFPLEAGVDPAFEIADETEMARFASEALDLTLRAARGLLVADEHVRLLLTRVKAPLLRDAMTGLVDRRHVIGPAIAGFVRREASCPSAAVASRACIERLRAFIRHAPDRAAILDDGPRLSAEFRWLHADLSGIETMPADDPAGTQQLRRRLERYFLTKDGEPRKRLLQGLTAREFASPDARRRHETAMAAWAPVVLDTLDALDKAVTGLLARGLQRLFAIATRTYEQLLDEHALMDFAGMLAASVALLERQEEFARSRLKLQSRYHHVLVDEFQDTSRAQWRLIELLIDAWGEGEGVTDAPTSIFVVGDRKQSIYRFRHAEATLLEEAARKIGALRPGRAVRRAITHSFRAVPELLAFVNAFSTALQSDATLPERFAYGDTDRFPVPAVAPGALRDGEPVLGAIAELLPAEAASAVASEVARLLAEGVVRDRLGPPRAVRPDDIAILFRARAGHQLYEDALERRGIRTYVYKGLGFFDTPEVQDVQALIRYLADPASHLRAAELLRSRIVRVSDVGLAALAPDFAGALQAPDDMLAHAAIDDRDRRALTRARDGVRRWLRLADRVTPGELLDRALRESAYAFELGGRRFAQARENLKKARALVRRVETRGYTTLGRLADYFRTLKAGEESNAIVAAAGCVSLMTIHAAKGLEFPIVFVVNLQTPGRGRGQAFTVIEHGATGEPEVAFTATAATRLEDRREEEELRRLFYVAATRARDRLYLGCALDPRGRIRRGARTMAQLLPLGLAEAIAAAATAPRETAMWETPAGSFAFKMCRPAPVAAVAVEPVAQLPPVDRLSIVAAGRDVTSATAAHRPEAGPSVAPDGGRSDRLAGTLVHRLFQRQVAPGLERSEVASLALSLVREDERVTSDDPAGQASQAADLFVAMRRRDEVGALLASGRASYEVPFSYCPPGRPGAVVRGVIDCVVDVPAGPLTIIEFKTGRPRPEHEAQAGLYAAALRTAIPGREIVAKILYP